MRTKIIREDGISLPISTTRVADDVGSTPAVAERRLMVSNDSPLAESNTMRETTAVGVHLSQHTTLAAAPCVGGTYMIVAKGKGQAIAILDGNLVLQNVESHLGARHWVAVQTDGFRGFSESESGRYLGHNGKHSMQAVFRDHLPWEYIESRPHQDGGCEMWIWHPASPESGSLAPVMLTVAIAEDGNSLVARGQGGQLWEFVEVQDR